MGSVVRGAAMLAAAAAAALAGCGGGSSNQPVFGTVLGGTQAAATVGAAEAGIDGICGGAVSGTQVIVRGPSGTLLATTNLRRDAKATAALKLPSVLAGPEGELAIYEFSTSIPAGNGPYTIDVVGVSNLVVPDQQLSHLQLSCG